MMYFWTIYREDAETADPAFFALQLETLCAWTEADPIDANEQARSQQISLYQSGKENPFVLDCTLSKRLYCSNQSNCSVSTTPMAVEKFQIQVFPDHDQLVVHADRASMVHIALFNFMGQRMKQAEIFTDTTISYDGLAHGIYLVHIKAGNEQFVKKVFLY